MALSEIKATEIEENGGLMVAEVKGFTVLVKGSKYRGFAATFSVLWDDEGGSDAHIEMDTYEAIGDTIKELKEEIMYTIKDMDHTAGQISKMARKLDFTGEYSELLERVGL
ncbi:hypothetical protein FIU82_06170 [Pseudoalteromonas sp. THAF3]|uniref:hypothetical protein n=1 Tax=Pseudoalteromonas sp. THAF3 TaxID=2587843 RepID=UPI0012680B85|nr:hypothetical protein [Pseudoalteromonas sp. THAF3]QFU04602.1 hypothetical protein FIU82_06170 [Pseudoalteromonas sp. THAF3]